MRGLDSAQNRRRTGYIHLEMFTVECVDREGKFLPTIWPFTVSHTADSDVYGKCLARVAHGVLKEEVDNVVGFRGLPFAEPSTLLPASSSPVFLSNPLLSHNAHACPDVDILPLRALITPHLTHAAVGQRTVTRRELQPTKFRTHFHGACWCETILSFHGHRQWAGPDLPGCVSAEL